ncbi:hypothetical protein ACHAWF_017904 [Thalassiosira exigua]
MPSRRRNKGRQRKARADSRDVGPSTAPPQPATSPTLRSLSPGVCRDGTAQLDQINVEDRSRVFDFVAMFLTLWGELGKPNRANMFSQGLADYRTPVLSAYGELIKATHANQPETLADSTLREAVKETLLHRQINRLLERGFEPDDFTTAGMAMALLQLESYDESSNEPFMVGDVELRKNRHVLKGCWRSTVKFFAKRMPCGWLDELLSEVKSHPKTGLCYNCTTRKELSVLKVCNGCKAVDYCSVECQETHWPQHQKDCKTFKTQHSKK